MKIRTLWSQSIMGLGAWLLPCLLMGQLAAEEIPAAESGERYASEQPVEPIIEEPNEEPNEVTNAPANLAPAAAPSQLLDAEALVPEQVWEKPVGHAPEQVPPEQVAAEQAPLVPVHGEEGESAAARLMRQALATPEQEALSGRAIYLAEMLGAGSQVNPSHRDLLEAYWRLTTAVGDYHLTLAEHDQLVQTFGPQTDEEPALEAAIAAAYARVQTARLTAVEAQHELAARLLLPADDALPLPGDRPLVVPYRTHYETLFAQRPDPAERRQARRIDDTLPLRMEAINAQAAAVEADQQLLDELAVALEAGRGGEAMYLARHEKLRDQRRAFLQAVLHYNLTIAQYALLVATEGMPARTLLPMLMQNPPAGLLSAVAPAGGILEPAPLSPLPDATLGIPAPNGPSGAAPSAIIPATAEEPLAAPPADAAPPAEPRRLRSVVVPSQAR